MWVELEQCRREFVSEVVVCPMISLGGVERASGFDFSYRIKLQDMLHGRKEVIECFLHEIMHIWLMHVVGMNGSHQEFEKAIIERAATLATEHDEAVWQSLILLLHARDIASFLR